jgi:hypothetical protein
VKARVVFAPLSDPRLALCQYAPAASSSRPGGTEIAQRSPGSPNRVPPFLHPHHSSFSHRPIPFSSFYHQTRLHSIFIFFSSILSSNYIFISRTATHYFQRIKKKKRTLSIPVEQQQDNRRYTHPHFPCTPVFPFLPTFFARDF